MLAWPEEAISPCGTLAVMPSRYCKICYAKYKTKFGVPVKKEASPKSTDVDMGNTSAAALAVHDC